MLNKKSFLIFCMIFLVGISFVGAVKPITSIDTTERGVDIIHPETINIPVDQDLEFNFWTYNSSNGATITNASLNCTVYLINEYGVNFWRFSNNAGASGLITYGKGGLLCENCWTMTLPKENISISHYSYQIKCQGENIGGYVTGFITANNYGEELTEATNSNFNFSMVFLMILFVLALIGMFMIDHYIGKFALYWICHVLFIVGTFSVWQFNQGYAVAYLGLAGVWKILFYVSAIAVVPMVFLSIAWIVYIHLFNEHFQKLVDKGVDTEEAFKIANKKRGGWFNGQ